jgi:DivIVA domain-containing protein
MHAFSVVMRGYARREVDDLFARIDGTLGRGPATGNPVTAAELRAGQLSMVMRGYAPAEVGEALNAALQELDSRGT